MTEYSKIDDLFGNVATETLDVDIPSGGRVQVRGMTRYEHMLLGRDAEGDGMEFEPRLLAMCVVEPALTLEDARRWQRSARPKDIAVVTDAIRDLSGLGEGAQKSDVSGDGSDGEPAGV